MNEPLLSLALPLLDISIRLGVYRACETKSSECLRQFGKDGSFELAFGSITSTIAGSE